jgi:hypothetical protein
MEPGRLDLSVMRGAVGVLAISVLISAIILGASYYFREEMKTEFNRHEVRFKDVSRKYLAVDEEERIVKTSYPRFVDLYNHGIIGHESRLSWVETLNRAGERIRLPELRYKVASREAYLPEFPVVTGTYQIYASTMELEAGLLHEGDFVALTEILDREADGLYSISKCTFKRSLPEISMDADKTNVFTKCDLEWFSINLPGDQEIVL